MNLAEEYSNILKKIKSFQNGQIADSLVELGGTFCMTFGLSTDQLRQISQPYKNKNNFAWFLWSKDVRETKLIALMIFNHEELSDEEINNLVYSFSNSEMVEQAVLSLLVNLPDAIKKAGLYCQNESVFVKMTGYSLLARLSIKGCEINEPDIIRFFQFAKIDSLYASVHVKRAISFAIRKVGLLNNNFRYLALNLCDELENSDSDDAKWIAFDIKIELETN